MAIYNITKIGNLNLLQLSGWYNNEVYQYFPNDGSDSISQFDSNVVALGTPISFDNSVIYNQNGVYISGRSSGLLNFEINGRSYSAWGSTSRDTYLLVMMNDSAVGFRIGVVYKDNYARFKLNTKSTNQTDYNTLLGLLPPEYVWQSVPSISGKNGILLELAHHLDVNDGEPITTEDTSKFNRKWINNVGRIIETKINE